MKELAAAMGKKGEAAGGNATPRDTVQHALRTVREHLEMDVAYISDISGDDWVLLAVDHAPGAPDMGGVGTRLEKDLTFCHQTAIEALPPVVPATDEVPLAKAINEELPWEVGAHIAVPLNDPDTGQAYGMFCCFSANEARTLHARDRDVMAAFASVSAEALRAEVNSKSKAARANELADQILRPGCFTPHFQPIVDLHTEKTVGVEALARFHTGQLRSPSECFAMLDDAGRRVEIEIDVLLRAADVALGHSDLTVGLNLSPQSILDDRFNEVLDRLPLERVVLEVTEHAPVDDYPELLARLSAARERGMTLAVDDAGGGYASLNHVLSLAPDIIKTDRALIRGLDKDPARQALLSALASFADRTGACLLAEGIETEGELLMARELGVDRVQGFLLGRPVPIKVLEDTVEWAEAKLRDTAAMVATEDRGGNDVDPEAASAALVTGTAGAASLGASLQDAALGGDANDNAQGQTSPLGRAEGFAAGEVTGALAEDGPKPLLTLSEPAADDTANGLSRIAQETALRSGLTQPVSPMEAQRYGVVRRFNSRLEELPGVDYRAKNKA